MIDNFDKYRNFIWYNGEFVDPRDAKLSVMSHTLHYGSGFFEGIRAYTTNDNQIVIFRLKEHVKRLIDSAKVYYVDVPYTQEEIEQAIIDVVKINEFKSCYIRPLVFLSEGFRTISITDDIKVNLMVSAWEVPLSDNEITLSVSSYRRMMSSQTPMQAKAIGNYMNSLLIRREAIQKGDDDGIALDMDGYVSELSTANIFLVKDNQVITPDLSSSILNGLTRLTVITLLKDLGYEVIERKIARDELYYADEIFVTGTASEVKICNTVDNIKVGSGNYNVSKLIKKEVKLVVSGQKEQYMDWLTYVK